MQWTGDFYFADCWAAYRGPAGDNTPHAHAALQVTLAKNGPVSICDSAGEPRQGRALVVRAGAIHTLGPSAELVVLLCDPNSAAASPLKAAAEGAEVALLPEALAARFPTDAPLAHLMDGFSVPRATIDARLQAAMDFLDAAPGRRIEEAARHCGLSPARLRAIAAADLEVPLGNWQNWRMLWRAGLALGEGASLAEAAQAGGFADQAHFSRTMRRMTGLTPSAARTPLYPPSDPFKTS